MRAATAVAVRHLVDGHLRHEAGAHLMIGFLDQAGTPQEVEVVLGNLPEPARPLVPAMREQAAATLRSLGPLRQAPTAGRVTSN
ncbi:MAG TPA: hypothetical protein VGS19_38835 [Streptosporangiaceae bacterium]|nr:hypothetical protein [Streptosporangiaceae bacterium]